MEVQVREEEQIFPWTHPEVQELHSLFDKEFASTHSAEEGEALFQRFFAPTGLLEGKIREWQGKDVELQEVLRIAFELYSFKCFVFTCFFFNDYPEEVVKEWWQNIGMRSCASEQAFSEPTVKKIKQMFDKESEQCESLLDLEGVRGKYLSPVGVLAQEFKALRAKDVKQQVAIGAELFSLKSYIDYTLFMIEFSTKVAAWTVPQVRQLVYQFEYDLKSGRTEEDFQAVRQRFMGADGLIETSLRKLQQSEETAPSAHVEELTRLRDAFEEFFSSHAKGEK